MSKDFSDAPLTIDGVTVQPTWPWSRQYRASVAEQMRRNAKSHLTRGEIEHRYAAWYAAKHGLTLEQARGRRLDDPPQPQALVPAHGRPGGGENVTPTIPSLPRPRPGKCPWCQVKLCDSYYEDELSIEVEDLEDGDHCPECERPITVIADEKTTTTYDVSIRARRTETDRKYMREMGIEEPKVTAP